MIQWPGPTTECTECLRRRRLCHRLSLKSSAMTPEECGVWFSKKDVRFLICFVPLFLSFDHVPIRWVSFFNPINSSCHHWHSCHPWNRPSDSVPRRRPAVQRPESARDFLSWNRGLMYFPEISVLGDFKQPLESVEMIPMIQRCLAHITIGPCLYKATRPPQINRSTWVPSGYLT